MAKQFIIADGNKGEGGKSTIEHTLGHRGAMEEVFGEYILNMSKENLKIAALKGKIKLENVQLDGELIGSHVLGAVGLQGFGILSCSAQSIKISVPWGNLEKEPTKFEVRGIHLVCVPLMPSTANKMYGAGTTVDPRCRLRTRAKRLTLARFERNYWNGQIPNEGPPMKRIVRAVKEVEREHLKRSRKRGSSKKGSVTSEEEELSDAFDNLVLTLDNPDGVSTCSDSEEKNSKNASSHYAPDDLPELPRDWKVKLREKVFRNMEASMYDVHIRVEVSERGLDFSHEKSGRSGTEAAEDRAFALGFTLDSLVVRTANDNWEIGSHDKRKDVDSSNMSSAKSHLGPNPYVVYNNKIGFFNKLSMYWDDEPPILLAETDVLQGNYSKLSPDKLQSRIAAAMEAMFHKQEPGKAVRKSLSVPVPSDMDEDKSHRYVCEGLDAEIRMRQSDRALPGPISCSGDVFPFTFNYNIRPHQYLQYQKLKTAMKSQQRFDTMLRQRPTEGPMDNPRAWWKYVIACVTSRPNWRPWEDVQRIVKRRRQYIELVMTKNMPSKDGRGYHAGLSVDDSSELLVLEDLLPIEALMAFHLIALRKVYSRQKNGDSSQEEESPSKHTRSRSRVSERFFLRRGRSNSSKRASTNSDSGKCAAALSHSSHLQPQLPGDEDVSVATSNAVTLLEAMTMRLGKKVWVVDWRFHDATVNVTFLHPRDDTPLAQWVLRGRGSARSFGLGKRDFFFDITQFDVVHQQSKVLFLQSSEEEKFADSDDYELDELSGNPTVSFPLSERGPVGPDLLTPSEFLDLPPPGVVCQLAGGKSMETLKLSVSAHPATLVWTTSLYDGLSEFAAASSTDLTLHVRNAATPLARKAQLALLSPVSMALHLNIAAPKVWVPIMSADTEGALLFDAGTLKLAGVKSEGETNMNWDVNTKDIKVNFVRGHNPIFRDDMPLRSLSHLGEISGRSVTSVVRPVHVCVEAYNRVVEDGIDESRHHAEVFNSGQFRSIAIAVSPVCLNLVDAEVLARAMGKWYASGLRRVRRRVSPTGGGTVRDRNESKADEELRQSNQAEAMPFNPGSIPRLLSVTVEKLEMALEGHSKILPTLSDERSVASQDSLPDMTPHTRTYLVEVFRIEVRRSQQDQLSMTRLSVMDASIERLKDRTIYSQHKLRREATESQDCILVRTSSRQSGLKQEPETEIVRASLLHDGLANLDEVEIDIDSVVLRVTPTTLKDCAKAFRRIAELAQLMTKEMERKVHEQGRKARQRGRRARVGDSGHNESPTSSGRPPSPVVSEVMTDVSAYERRTTKAPSDSSILFRVTLSESTLLAGRPTAVIQKSRFDRNPSTSFAVIQVLSNALVMFQSIENPDGTGIKTLHVSVDNASSLVNTEFERVSPAQAPPMIGPTGAEFRVVYATESLGCVVSQDISVDCEAVKSCLTPNDLSIMIKVVQKMVERLRAFNAEDPGDTAGRQGSQQMRPWSSLIRYQKKGTGIATSIRMEIHAFSFVLLKAYKANFGAPEFLDFNVRDLKVKLEGCMSALSGECSAVFCVNFFNPEVSDWEYAVEPFPFSLGIDQMPNELVLNLSPACPIQLNLAGILLRDLAEMKFDILRDRSAPDKGESDILAPSVLSTVGLRRATEAPSIHVRNLTGFDVQLNSSSSEFEQGFGLVVDGATITLDAPGRVAFVDVPGHVSPDGVSLALTVAPSAVGEIGERDPVFDLPITSSASHSARVHILRPVVLAEPAQSGEPDIDSGRASPDTVLTEGTRSEFAYYHAEPVVEWCMHNQRLRSSTADVFSLQKGSDVLSSSVWSPEDEVNDDNYELSEYQGRVVQGDPEQSGSALSPERKLKLPITHSQHQNNWLRPYLKNDSPEWTDMTCTLRMARERVMLPDNNWIWVNDWTVDLSGSLGESTDSDGWEYQADFETFSKKRRYYERGDSCRRRRWTRTRMVKPPRLDDPNRLLKFVWESSKEDNGNISVVVRSHVQIKNETGGPLTFFVLSPSWHEHKNVGTAKPGETVNVPVAFASAVYLQLAKTVGAQEPASIQDCVSSESIMILPTSHTSETVVRASMNLQDVSGTTLHFLVEIVSNKGIVDIVVKPVLRVVNLLPCQLQCQLGEVVFPGDARVLERRPVVGKHKKRIVNAETLQISSGDTGNSTALNPWFKPHISLRVPGYKWSAWERIVNRNANSNTWRPSEDEEDWQFSSKGDSDFAEEFKTIVRFERSGQVGDPLTLVISVESGHCPTLRVYSQYWIIDKTGFGCRFCDGFNDSWNTVPEIESSRRSHLLYEEAKDPEIRNDMAISGHQWSIGMSGMSLYYSKREKLALSIETGIGDERKKKKKHTVRSKWVSPLDISNVMPKTVFSVDELGGPRRFELAISVTVCPGMFARTKLITLLPRYQIINLLHRELVVAQDSCLDAETLIPSQTGVPFHWERGSLAPKVRLGAPSIEERDRGIFEKCWTNGRFRLDRVGITSLRLPTINTLSQTPMVVQAEVRLATKDQSSAVVVVIWSANEKSNPLYVIRNSTPHTILCRQPLQDEEGGSSETGDGLFHFDGCTGGGTSNPGYECDISPTVRSFWGLDRTEEFVWVLKSGDVACFGFDDPEKPHIIEWTCVSSGVVHFDEQGKKAFLEVDAMGSSSTLNFAGGGQVRCQIGAEHSTKVIEFVDSKGSLRQRSGKTMTPLRKRGLEVQEMLESEVFVVEYDHEAADDEDVAFSFRIDMPALSISVVDNTDPEVHGREILLAQFEKIFFAFSQTREGYHELELRLMTFQVDNHVQKSIHPVLIFCPRFDENEPLLHMSAVRRLQLHSNTFVFRYAAIRLLDIEIFLDRRTAETIARFIAPLSAFNEAENEEPPDWVFNLTASMGRKFATPDRRAPRDIEKMIHTANSGRIYFEQLHLHPVRLSLTFTQEWMEWNPGSEAMMVFQFIRGMASIANAPLTFTSFVVGHVYEAPQALARIIATHYSSQLTKQIFGLLGSLAILGAPADFISNVGTGVRDFFYEPIQGAVQGPRQFIEGLEAGTQSLARGVFVGVVRGAANVTEVFNANLAGLIADDDFIDERKAHQRLLTDAMSRGSLNRTFGDSLVLAGGSVARGIKSGAFGIVEQPIIYASKHGPVGFVKGVGKAILGAVVKPVVGLGDAAVLVMNHVSDATSKKLVLPKIPKRLRRALPSRSTGNPNCVRLEPYDERAAKAQKIVTGGESVEDVYIGHIDIPSHLIIASEQSLWAIDRRSREPWCVSWEEISHFGIMEGGVRVVVFSQTGLKTYVFQVENASESVDLHKLLSMQLRKMGNSSELNSYILNAEPESLSRDQIPGIKARQVNHVFGSCNKSRARLSSTVNDEIDIVEQCFARVKVMESDSSTFLKTLDEEAWSLVSSWGHVFSGLSSRRCIVASVINGTGFPIQIKATKLVEGGSPCYSIPTSEFDAEQGILNAGGVIIFFGWGVVPNLLQPGNVFMHVETNGFISDLSGRKNRSTVAEAMPGYQVGFLEKSYDDSGWWAKYWMLVRKK